MLKSIFSDIFRSFETDMRLFRPALSGALLLVLTSLGAAMAAPMDDPARVRLTKPCERPSPGGCIIHISMEGTITSDTPQKLLTILNDEMRRVSAPVVPYLNIASPGGDVNAAMQIGDLLRKTTATVVSSGPCQSACVFVAVGGVERNLSGVGIHRPFFAQTQAKNFFDADQRYKKMMNSVRTYLQEMNISDDLLRMMVAVPPGEMQVLSPVEAKRIGINGFDPAWDEYVTAREARTYGLTSAELRKRRAVIETQCGREDLMRSLAELQKREECRRNFRERILWGMSEEKVTRLTKMSEQICREKPLDSDETRNCRLTLAERIRGEDEARPQSSSR
jgi:ATP-dependent protease ClpP protease subunit